MQRRDKLPQLALALLCFVGLLSGPISLETEGDRELMAGTMAPLTTAQQANVEFKKARSRYRQGQKLERSALRSDSASQRGPLLDKAAWRYQQSADAYERSLASALKAKQTPEYLPYIYQELADAELKLAHHEAAVAAYNRAIDLVPPLAPVRLRMQYARGRSYLALNNTNAAQRAYVELLDEAEIRADAWKYVDAMIGYMQSWSIQHRESPEGLDAGQIEAFGLWVAEQTVALDDTVRWSLLEDE